MCDVEWSNSWERDAQGRRLAVTVNFDTYFPLTAGRECDPLRPVFIDGPSIGEAYDEQYPFKKHEGQHSQQDAASCPLQQFRPFPVMALCQTLFSFIARGHKTVALLPGIYDERTPGGMFGNDVSHIVDNVHMLRKLVKMHLVEFKKTCTDFDVSVRSKVREACGALVAGYLVPHLDMPEKSTEEAGISANEPKKNKKQSLLGPSSMVKKSDNPKDEKETKSDGTDTYPDTDKEKDVEMPTVTERKKPRTRKTQIVNDHSFLHSLPPNHVPIIKPFFYTMRKERRMSVTLDSPCFQGVLPTVGELLVFPRRVESELAKHWQLTLFTQYRLLEELTALLNGHYPGGNKEKGVWQMVKETWEASGEVRRQAEDPLNVP